MNSFALELGWKKCSHEQCQKIHAIRVAEPYFTCFCYGVVSCSKT